jgi:small subunit ribosomal protein S24e
LEVKILEQRENPLLQRTEVRFAVSHPTTATPTREDVRSELSKLTKIPKDRLIIERMRARFGRAESHGEAAFYRSKEAAEKVVREHILVRNGLKERTVKAPATPPTPTLSPSPAPADETSKETP